MKPNEIRSLIALHEVNLTALAKELEVSTAAVHQVITGQRPNPRIRKAIAKAVKTPVNEIWPEPSSQKAAA